MILGIGIDIIEVARIQAAYEKHGQRFIERILRPAEIEYCLTHKIPGPFLAARFASKEAISKAFGTGICGQLGWQDMEVCRKPSGEPYVVLHDKALELMQQRGGHAIHLSISHTQVHATAIAILEAQGQPASKPPQ